MTQLVGILNHTPDSFSGDGLHQSLDVVLARIDAMIDEGASVIDIGAESTRPGAVPLSPDEEWQRLAPLVRSLGTRLGKVRFSMDTRHPETAARALAVGFHWINDVSGADNPDMLKLIQAHDCTFAVMHSLTVPADPKRTIAPSDDPVQVVLTWAEWVLAQCEAQGIDRSRVVIDPGIGFGKTPEQSLAIIKNIARFKALDVKLMVGHSRKSFLSLFTDKKASDRDPETLAVSQYLAGEGVDYLRVHDIRSHAAMLRIRAAV